MGAELTGFALQPPTQPSMFEETGVGRDMRSIIGDIRDLFAVQSAMQLARPEVVIHMAAQPLVRYSYQNPVETYATNVMGTVNLLEAVRQIDGVKAVVIVTTDKCYENREWAWGYRENEPMGGHDPYSNSKGCAELVSAAYRASFFNAADYDRHGVALATARAGNVIGGGDWALDRLLPDILAAFIEGKSVNIRSPHAVRPWQHVLEPLSGYLTLAERLCSGGPSFAEGWNFGPRDEDAKPVEWIVRRMTELWGSGADWQLDSNAQPHEAHYLKLDISKAASRLGWYPALRLDEALQLTVEWTRQCAMGADVKSITLNQIQQYQNRLSN
jgi:CDP-glucose 4,6-dehydratase